MSEFDTLNYAEHAYAKVAEGKLRIFKTLMLVGYVVFVGIYFLFCYITRIIPLFALCPLFLWIIIFFTWRYVSFDYYYTFQSGRLELGTIRSSKRGRKKTPKLTVTVKDAIYANLYTSDAEAELAELGVKTIHDYFSSSSSSERIILVFESAEGNYGVLFDGTTQSAKMIAAYCPAAKILRSYTFSK